MKKDRYLNLDVEFLSERKDTIHVAEKTYGVTFTQKGDVKTRVMIVQKGTDLPNPVLFFRITMIDVGNR